MRTLLNKSEQYQFLHDNWHLRVITHKWSTNGYGSSKILDERGNVLGKAGGCGYDRFGSAIGDMIENLFPEHVYKLAEKTRNKKARKTYQSSKDFYGLYFDFTEKRAWLDGACGDSCMRSILEKIGFKLKFVKNIDNGRTGYGIYQLIPYYN